MEEHYYTIKQVCERLMISRETVNRLIRRGELRAIKIGFLVRIGESDLADYLARQANVQQGEEVA